MLNLDSFEEKNNHLNQKKFSFMYATQRVPFVGRKSTNPTSLEKSPCLKKIPTSFKDKEESICWIFLIVVASFSNYIYE